MKHLRFTILFSFLLVFLIAFIPTAHAAQVSKVSGKKLVIALDGMEVTEGQEIYLTNPESGKKIGVATVEKVKGDKALASLTKGKALPNSGVIAKGGSEGPETATATAGDSIDAKSKTSPRRRPTSAVGLMVGLINTTMTFKFLEAPQSTQALAGSGFALTGFYDYPAMRSLSLRFMGGVENVMAAGKDNFGDEGDLNIMYLSLGGQARYLLTDSKSPFWLGFGGAFLIPISNSSSLIKTVSTNYYMAPALGMDISIGRSIIPIQIEYALFPESKDTKAQITYSSIIFRTGMSF